jgi:hypothetical protein
MFTDPEMLSRLRHRMMSVAYRMLGTVADARSNRVRHSNCPQPAGDNRGESS